MIPYEELMGSGVLVYNFSTKQLILLDTLKALQVAIAYCKLDLATRLIVQSSYDSIKGCLVAEIGREIVMNELKDTDAG